MNKVFIAIPTLDGWVHTKTIQAITAQSAGHEIKFVSGISPVAKARNTAVAEFLRTDCTHLWFVDSDTIPPSDALKRLLDMDADIASGVTPVLLNNGIMSNVFPSDDPSKRMTMEEVEKADTLINAVGVGASCILIKRRVLDNDVEGVALKSPWYAELWFEDGKFCSEDIFFCNKATDESYLITVDPKVICQHVKEVLI